MHRLRRLLFRESYATHIVLAIGVFALSSLLSSGPLAAYQQGVPEVRSLLTGYKLARARWSQIPSTDDALLSAISTDYHKATGLPYNAETITENMRQYFAFDWPELQHAVAPTTPSVILEMGFLTTPSDRKLLTEQRDLVASGIANGIIRFLTER